LLCTTAIYFRSVGASIDRWKFAAELANPKNIRTIETVSRFASGAREGASFCTVCYIAIVSEVTRNIAR